MGKSMVSCKISLKPIQSYLRGHRQHGVFLHVDVHVHFVAPQEAATEAAQGAPGATTAPWLGKHPTEMAGENPWLGKNTISSGYDH